MSQFKPRLVVNYATNALGAFEQAALATRAVADQYDVRMVVSHLARRKLHELHDPGDPYLQYSVNFSALLDFAVPQAFEPFVDAAFVAANLALLEQKMAILRKLGMKGAFLGREPVYAPEPVYREHPHWRGPRVDHPRRSRTPRFALCLHQPEVQALYRESAASLARRFPDLDTFYWWTNDSGAGFCWYPDLYPGPNGPEWCRERGPIPAMAAFHAAVLDGTRAGGTADPISLMTQTSVWDARAMPAGTYRYPPHASSAGSGAVCSLRADLSLTYPVRYLWDPLARLEQISNVRDSEPVAVLCWLSDIYHRTQTDLGTVRRIFALWRLADQQPAAIRRLPGRLALLQAFAATEFGAAASDATVDAWIGLHEAFTMQLRNPYRWPGVLSYLPTYGPVSHRWLTRPLVAFPDRLSAEEEAYFLPHVFALGDDARRHNLLELHGYPAAEPADDYRLRSRYFERLASAFDAAGAHFGHAAAQALPVEQADLETAARASRLMACLWRTCRHWLEFAVSRSQGVEVVEGPPGSLSADERARRDAYHRRLFTILRAELDNALTFQEILAQDATDGADGAMVLVRGAFPEDEDTFTLGPDLQAQLTHKREIMLAHWQDVTQLAPLSER